MDSQSLSSISSGVSSISAAIPFPPVQIAGQVLGALGNVASMFMASKEKQAQQDAVNRANNNAQAVSQGNSLLLSSNPKAVELGLGGLLRTLGGNVASETSNPNVGRTLQGNTHETGSTQVANNVLAEKGEFSYTDPNGKILIFSNRI
jgi:hypothetical protein